MIEGLKLSITTAQLAQLLEQRREYHEKRAEKFKARALVEAADQEDAEEESAGIGKYANSIAGYGGQSASQRYRHHLDRATVAAFRVKYLIPNETYVLTESDLQTLEVLKPY